MSRFEKQVIRSNELLRPHQTKKKSESKGIVHVIDDELDIVKIISDTLQKEGYVIHSFSDTTKAMADMAFCRMNMRLVITDIRMPGHNGFEIAREARKLKANIPIVFMTSFEVVPSEFERLFPSLTGINLLKKPFHLKTLMELVGSIKLT